MIYFFLKPKPKTPPIPPRVLTSGSYIIKQNNQYLYFDRTQAKDVNNPLIIQNIILRESPTVWTLEIQSDE